MDERDLRVWREESGARFDEVLDQLEQLRAENAALRRLVLDFARDVAEVHEWGALVFSTLVASGASLAALPPAPPPGDPAAIERWTVSVLHTLIALGSTFQVLSPSRPLQVDDREVVGA